MKKSIFTIGLTLIPLVSFAQGATFKSLTNSWVGFLNQVIGVLGSLAFLFFMWGGAMVVLGSGDSNKVAEGKQRMVWSLIGLFVMFSVWGLLGFIDGTLFGGTSSGVGPPASTGPVRGLGPI